MIVLIKLALLVLVSWIAGIAAYIAALAVFYHQSISGGDFAAIIACSAIAFVISFVTLYYPLLFTIRGRLRGVDPIWPFPFAATILGIIPTSLVILIWGGDFDDLISPEANLLHAMFTAVGLVSGFGYVLIYRDTAEQGAAANP